VVGIGDGARFLVSYITAWRRSAVADKSYVTKCGKGIVLVGRASGEGGGVRDIIGGNVPRHAGNSTPQSVVWISLYGALWRTLLLEHPRRADQVGWDNLMSTDTASVTLQWRFWGFHFGGLLGWRHFHLGGGHTTNTFMLNYRVCKSLISNYKHINTSKFIS